MLRNLSVSQIIYESVASYSVVSINVYARWSSVRGSVQICRNFNIIMRGLLHADKRTLKQQVLNRSHAGLRACSGTDISAI
jgi:hypothetical protein